MNTTTNGDPKVLRAAMVDQIQAAGHARSAAVETVMRAVPRHRFLPQASAEDAYADLAVITKRAQDGTALSCASVPTVVAMMLDQLDVGPGDHILEIGAGTGYNAALLADLTVPDGHVTTVDVDPEVTAGARENLDANGYERVEVITRDGALGAPENAPYDRIIFTVGAWDLPPALWQQLKPGGRLVVPLRWRGQTRSVAFVRRGDELRSESMQLCGFVPMVGQEGERTGPIDDDGHASLFWDVDQPIDTEKLAGVLTGARTEVWSGVVIGGNDSFDGIWLRMTAGEPGICRLAVQPAAVEMKLCAPAIASRTPALAEGSSLAYLTIRRVPSETTAQFELGAIGHGPEAGDLAERLCEHIRRWNTDRSFVPQLSAYPTGTTQQLTGSTVIEKAQCWLVTRVS